jgi:hypothetical protein
MSDVLVPPSTFVRIHSRFVLPAAVADMADLSHAWSSPSEFYASDGISCVTSQARYIATLFIAIDTIRSLHLANRVIKCLSAPYL